MYAKIVVKLETAKALSVKAARTFAIASARSARIATRFTTTVGISAITDKHVATMLSIVVNADSICLRECRIAMPISSETMATDMTPSAITSAISSTDGC